MLAQVDIILIKAKMKDLGLRQTGLAKKVHTNTVRLDKVLNHNEENLPLEERLIKWLSK